MQESEERAICPCCHQEIVLGDKPSAQKVKWTMMSYLCRRTKKLFEKAEAGYDVDDQIQRNVATFLECDSRMWNP